MLRSLARGTSVVALGTAAGQAAVLFATPWLARIYTPAEFGALALITTVSNIAMAAGCLRYDLALPSASKQEAGAVLRVAMLAAVVAGALATLITFAIGTQIGHPLQAPFDAPWLIGLCVLLVGLHQVALGWTTRVHAFTQLGAVRLAQGLGFAGLASLSSIGLLWAHVLSFLAAVPPLWRAHHNSAGDTQLRKVALAQRQFPLASLPGALLDVVGYSLCVWVVTRAYGVTDAGQYAQVQRLVGAPLMLIGLSVGQVMLRHTADLASDGLALRALVGRVFSWLAGLGLLVVAAVALIGEPLLGWLLGAQWRVDPLFVTPIALAVAVRACVSPLSTVLITLRRFDLALRWQAAYFFSAGSVLPLAASQLPIAGFVLVYALHECVFYGAYFLLIQSAIRSTCAASSA